MHFLRCMSVSFWQLGIFFYLGFNCQMSLIPKKVGIVCLAVLVCSEYRTANHILCLPPHIQPFFTQPKTLLLTPLATTFVSLHNIPLTLYLTLILSSHLAFLPSTFYLVQMGKVEKKSIFFFVLCICFLSSLIWWLEPSFLPHSHLPDLCFLIMLADISISRPKQTKQPYYCHTYVYVYP